MSEYFPIGQNVIDNEGGKEHPPPQKKYISRYIILQP